MENWLKWLLLCLFATFHYILFGIGVVIFFSFNWWQAIVWLGGITLSFCLFVTVFYWLDSWLIRRNNTRFSDYFIYVSLLRYLGILIGICSIMLLGKFIQPNDGFFIDLLFEALFGDVYVTVALEDIIQTNGSLILHTLFPSYEGYKLANLLILVLIFLGAEALCILVSMLMLATFSKVILRTDKK